MVNAEGFNRTKDLKRLETSAREATQMAEDARRITLQKQADKEIEQAAAAVNRTPRHAPPKKRVCEPARKRPQLLPNNKSAMLKS